MGNNPSSSSSKLSTQATSTSGPASGAAHGHGHHGHSHESPWHHHRKDARNIMPGHTHRSAAPPEPSLAQAHGSTVSRPKSFPPITASSLSGSPLSSISTPIKNALSVDAKTIPQPKDDPAEAKFVAHDQPTQPVDVPTEPSSSLRSHHSNEPVLFSNSNITDMYLTRPPRLPLPIDEEVHTPGSPILAPQMDELMPEIGSTDSPDGTIVRKNSSLSVNTVDEEEGEELRVDKTRPVVPTKLEWISGGEKVYVTGTIFQWNRKQRLLPINDRPGCFATTVYVLPGTHHVRFLVDGIMQTSPDLPTTVDFGNNLVNYIEVSSDDAFNQKDSSGESNDRAQTAAMTKAAQENIYPPDNQQPPQQPKGKEVLPPEAYRCQMPQYLVDFDQPEDSRAFQYAASAMEKMPSPPTLPGFLSKPILNAATLLKDDNSVLNMPNHTVLNHLATSSIKNNVLAVSATTRYRDKYVTTIVYKPASADEG